MLREPSGIDERPDDKLKFENPQPDEILKP